MIKHALLIFILMSSLIVTGGIVSAQDNVSDVTVQDQFVYDDTITVETVVSDGPGFIVIHTDDGNGAPGSVIGYRAISSGTNTGVVVPLDIRNATPQLFAMLHTDTGEVGTYEFGQVDGVDGPVIVDESVVMQSFDIELISMSDQIVGESNTVNASVIVTRHDGWLVIHADDGNGAPGAIIGETFVTAGTTHDVMVSLQGDPSPALYPMLHTDTGEPEVYEFDTVEGADPPVHIGGRTAATSCLTVPTMRVQDQIVIGSDATASNSTTTTLRLDSVLSDGNGWLVVYASDENGNPGKVIGHAAVQDGYNANVVVELNTADVTPVLFPTLHEDSGEALVYEFGEVDGVDGPVSINGQIVAVPVNVAPNIVYAGTLHGNVLTMASALIDGPGWLVIHADNGEGAPGEVLGYAPLLAGLNTNINVELNANQITDTLFPMLHYDNNEQGLYEFGEVEGADGPVIVNGDVIVGSLNPTVN